MDDLVGGLILGVIALTAVVFVAATVLYVALLVLLIAGPTFGCAFWLRSLNRRFVFSKQKKGQCAVVALVAFSLPLLIAVAGPLSAATAIWLGVPLALSAIALFLTIEAYRQTIWPLRKQYLAAAKEATAIQLERLKVQRTFESAERTVNDKESRFTALLSDTSRLRELIDHLVRECDPALYSGATLRWKRECRQMEYEALVAWLDRIRNEVEQCKSTDPRRVTLALQAAVVRMEAQERLVVGNDRSSFSGLVKDRDACRRELDELNRQLLRLEQVKTQSREGIARRKNQVLTVN